jgi:hypothetical protein
MLFAGNVFMIALFLVHVQRHWSLPSHQGIKGLDYQYTYLLLLLHLEIPGAKLI